MVLSKGVIPCIHPQGVSPLVLALASVSDGSLGAKGFDSVATIRFGGWMGFSKAVIPTHSLKTSKCTLGLCIPP